MRFKLAPRKKEGRLRCYLAINAPSTVQRSFNRNYKTRGSSYSAFATREGGRQVRSEYWLIVERAFDIMTSSWPVRNDSLKCATARIRGVGDVREKRHALLIATLPSILVNKINAIRAFPGHTKECKESRELHCRTYVQHGINVWDLQDR